MFNFRAAILTTALVSFAGAFSAHAQGYGYDLGTLIVFPKFDIRQTANTQMRIVNHSEEQIRVRYNYVCPGTPHVTDFCAKLDKTVTLTPHETRVIEARADHPPCNQGFVVAYPIDNFGHPVSYNYLLGSYSIREGRRDEADNAFALPSLKETGTILATSGNFNFNPGQDQDFAELSSILHTDFQATSTDLVSGSKLVLLDLGSLLGMQNPMSTVFVDFWNSAEIPYSSALQFICWTEVRLDSIDANFFEENLGTMYGSLLVESVASCPIAGGCPPLIPHAPILLGALEEYGDDTRGIHELVSELPPLAITPQFEDPA